MDLDGQAIISVSLLPASCTCQSRGDNFTAARGSGTAVVGWLVGQHAGTASVGPEPTGSPDILQGKLLGMSKTRGGTGGLSETTWLNNLVSW